MNVSKAERRRWWLTFLLDDLPTGANFSSEALHLTVIPWFVTSQADQQVVDSFQSRFTNLDKLTIKIGPQTKLGERQVPVNLVEPHQKLEYIHQIALNWFRSLDGRWALKNPYIDSEYQAHIRRRDDTKLDVGQSIDLHWLSLIKAKRQEDGRREIAAKVGL